MSIKGGFTGSKTVLSDDASFTNLRYMATAINIALFAYEEVSAREDLYGDFFKSDTYKEWVNEYVTYIHKMYERRRNIPIDSTLEKKFKDLLLNRETILYIASTRFNNDEGWSFGKIQNSDSINSELFLKYIKDHGTIDYDVATLAWGSGGSLQQVIPYLDSYKEKTIGKKNIVLSFDKFEEAAFGPSHLTAMNVNTIDNYMQAKCSWYGQLIESSQFVLTMYDVEKKYGEMMNALTDEIISNTEGKNIPLTVDFFKKTCDTYINNCKNLSSNMNIKSIKIDERDNIDDIIEQLKEHEKKNQEMETILYAKMVKLKYNQDTVITDFTILFILDDIYPSRINYYFSNNKFNEKLLSCSVRDVECICDYMELEDIENFSHIYTSHGDINLGRISEISGSDFKKFKDSNKPYLNTAKTGISTELMHSMSDTQNY